MTDPTNPGPAYPPTPPSAPAPGTWGTDPTGQWQAPPAAGAPTGQWQAPPAPGGFPPAGGPPPVPVDSSGSGGGGKKIVLGIAALAVLAGGAFAATQLLSGGDRGAATPEEAGERLVEALNQSDILGVIDLLPEGEQQLLSDLAGDIASEGDRLGLLSDSFTLDGFPGLTIEVTDPEFEVEELSDENGDTPGLSLVSLVAGDASVEVDGDELTGNVGPVVEALVEELGGEIESVEDVSEDVDIADFLEEIESENEEFDENTPNPFTVAVIEEGGRFFPSLGFTAAEVARAEANIFSDDPIDAPDLDSGIDPEGADDPQGAVQALIDAATSGDAEEALAVLDPAEAGAAQVYVPLLSELPEAEDTGVEVEITAVDVEGIGGGASRVVPTGIEASGEFDGGSFEFTLEDGCIELSVETEDETFEVPRTCADDDLDSSLADDVDIPEEISELIDAVQPIEGGIVTVERDGGHFVSPTRTFAQIIFGSISGIEREDVEEGGIVFEAVTGGLEDEFADLGEQLEEAFEDADGEEIAEGVLTLLDREGIELSEVLVSTPALGVGFLALVGVAVASSFEESFEEGFEDFEDEFEDEFEEIPEDTVPEDDDFDVRTPTGASGPNGELLPGDVVAGFVDLDGEATFTVLGDGGTAFIGAQTLSDEDLTITVLDAAGVEIAFDDDFIGLDPEVSVELTEGQVVTVVVRELGGDPSDFVVYYET